MAKKTMSRHALYSRRLLQDALLNLLESRRYAKITVTDIVKQAELSRPTFYAHFETKDALLISYVDDLLDEISTIVSKNNLASDDSEFWPSREQGINMFTAWLERKEILGRIRSADIDYLIFKKIRDHHHQILSDLLPAHLLADLNPTLRSYCINYMAGSISMLLIHWIDNDMRHSPADMQQLIQVLNSQNFSLLTNKLNTVIV